MQVRIKTPAPKRPVVDRITFILPWACGPNDDPQSMYQRARRRIDEEMENKTCRPAFIKFKRYRFSFSIPLPGESKAIVQIGALDLQRQKGGISVTVNPARFVEGDVEYFHDVMESIVGSSYRILMQRALINRIDFAVDIVHANLSRMLVSYSGAQQFTVFGKTVNSKGIVETYNFGSASSDYVTAVYDKDIERRNRAVANIAKFGLRSESLKANFIKQLKQLHGAPPVVRVEVRGKKMRGLPLHKLEPLENRFARFTFADLDGAGAVLPKKLQDEFMSLCRDRGVKAALEHYKGSPDVRKINAFWRSRKADWWQPDSLWKQACGALRRTGLFPDATFAKGSVRRQASEPVPASLRPNRAPRPSPSLNEAVTFTRTGPAGRTSKQGGAASNGKKRVHRIP